MAEPRPLGDYRKEPIQPIGLLALPGVDLEPQPEADPLQGLPPAIRALRPLQWTKNLLVFAALIFTRSVLEWTPLWHSIGAFMVFCAVSSSIYLINDVRDVEQDRVHPVKRNRPIAAGELSVRTALIMAVGLMVGGLVAARAIEPRLFLVVGLYAVMMVFYNAGLKHIVILDVILISLGFVLRAAAGAVAIEVPISPWLYLCTMLLALLVGFGKRRHELLTLQDAAGSHRQNLEDYSIPMLDQVVMITAAATIASYAVYTVASPTLPDNNAMVLTVPIVVYAIFRYLFLLYRKHVGGSPEMLLIKDRPLRLSLDGLGAGERRNSLLGLIRSDRASGPESPRLKRHRVDQASTASLRRSRSQPGDHDRSGSCRAGSPKRPMQLR